MVAVCAIGAFVVVVAVLALSARRRGARVHDLDEWRPADGEHRLYDDPAADFYVVPRLGQARVMSFARRGRASAVVTDRALVVAMKAAFSKRRIITHLIRLGPGDPSDAESDRLGGGLFSKGYIVLAAQPANIAPAIDGAKHYVRIVPDPTASATNIEHLRLYCDDAARMCAALGADAERAGG